MMIFELLVIEREAAVAHPSFASGGFVVLKPGATSYRNADMVRCSAREVLDWCRDHKCEIVAVPDPAPSNRRVQRVRFPDEETRSAFLRRFPARRS